MSTVVIILCKGIAFLTGLFGGGTNLPGQIALKLRPDILKKLTRGYKVILVTGTNGKTTTAAMLASIIRAAGRRAVSNSSGANMKAGIVSCFIKAFPLLGGSEGAYAVIEVDEAYMKQITAEISPEVIAVTNIFRDQLDRYGEVDRTLRLIREGAENTPESTFVLNADESFLYDLMPMSKRFYFGFRVNPDISKAAAVNAEGKFCRDCHEPYDYHFLTFNHLGSYYCEKCGKHRPDIDLGVDKAPVLSADSSLISLDGLEIALPQPGTYNVYNALCAATAAGALSIGADDIKAGLESQGSKFGRQETIMIDSREVRLILVKNPAGCDEAINSLLPDTDAVQIGFLLNDNPADGTDVSWIYDVSFEKLVRMNYQSVIIGGTRCFDMAVRLKCSGLDANKFIICEDFDSLLYTIKTNMSGRIYLLSTYTAMISLRKHLHRKGYIKKLWH